MHGGTVQFCRPSARKRGRVKENTTCILLGNPSLVESFEKGPGSLGRRNKEAAFGKSKLFHNVYIKLTEMPVCPALMLAGISRLWNQEQSNGQGPGRAE